MINKKFNYHGHTYLCGHAGGTPVDYVSKAIELGLTDLGISEHAPMPNLNSKNSRLHINDFPLYLHLMDEAKSLAKSNNINFHIGLEIEYFDDLDVYEKYLKSVEYLILGQHYIVKNNNLKSTYSFDSLEDVKVYADTIIKALNTGYFSMLCHPDLCFFNIPNPTDEMYAELREVISECKRLDIPIELNANGIRRSKYESNNTSLDPSKFKYPRIRFFDMVKELNAKVIISSDCHSLNDLYDSVMIKTYELAENMGLNLIDTLKFNKKQL